jgi:DHA2 family multidrug resistance protein-like MFS transporter
VLAVIYGVKGIAEHGLSGTALAAILVGLAAGLVFVRRQRTLTDPLIDLDLFANRTFSTALAVNTVGIFAMFGVYLFVPQYYQLVIGLSPFEAGLWTVPGSIVSIVGSMIAPVLVRWFPVRPLICGGLAMVVVGFAMLTQIGVSSLLTVVTSGVIMMLGFGVVMTLTVDFVMGAAPPERAGAASAISETGTELGGALGIAVLGSLAVAIYRRQVGEALPVGISAEAATTAQDTLGGAINVVGQLSDTAGPLFLLASREAFVDGLQFVAGLAAIITVGLAVAAGFGLGEPAPGGDAADDSRRTPQPRELAASHPAK